MNGVIPVPVHGGRLNAAVARYGIPHERWLDLSTGINPHGWPVPTLPAAVFSRLPEEDDGLLAVAADYYGTSDLLMVPGSQAAIQALPALRWAQSGPSRVGVLSPGYAEHAYCWQVAEHQLQPVTADQVDGCIDQLDVLVLINPCNPTGLTFSMACMRRWHTELASRGGWLLVDEAFIDATPELSLITHPMPAGLIVLRSLGKFFGLAGIRVGSICAEASILEPLSLRIGPWAISHPAREITRRALADTGWQQCKRSELSQAQRRLKTLLERCLGELVAGTALFAWVPTARAEPIERHCARAGILIRRFEQPSALRFGLPGDEADWQRLETVLSEIQL